MAQSGRVLGIYLRPASRTPVRPVPEATAVAGRGLEGDHAGGGRRQVTLIAREAWDAATGELGAELDPGARRANLLVEGVDLGAAIGRRLRIGDAVVVEVAGETKPCGLMDDAHDGLRDALAPACRGGVFGRIVAGGAIAAGAAVALAPEPPAPG